jgi:hypothetical protein
MCYGDIDHGTDGYYREYVGEMEQQWQQERENDRQQQEEQQGPE